MAAFDLVLLLSFLQVTSSVRGAKILLVPYYHYSHANMFGVAGAALTHAGHEVTMVVSDKFSKVPSKFDLHSIVYKMSAETDIEEELTNLAGKTGLGYWHHAIFRFAQMTQKICENALSDGKLLGSVEEGQFDLVIMDGNPVMNCFYVVPYKFNIPYMTLGFMVDPWSAGVPASAATEPTMLLPYTNQLTFLQRLAVATTYILSYTMTRNPPGGTYYTEKYAPGRPKTTNIELYRKSEMFLINQDILCMDYPRVSAPNYQFIGGSSARPAKPLPTELVDFVNGADDGLIIVTFGSHDAWQNMWKNLKTKMIYVLSRLQQRTILLYQLDDVTSDFPPNVKALKWVPQNDLLGHPNTKLFVTHGGNNGQLEAVYHGVPMIVLPLMADQHYNGMRVDYHGYGKMLDKWEDISEQDLLKEFRSLLSNQTYSDNVKKCSRIIKSQPSTQEQIVHWVNHVVEFGGSHLRSPAIGMPLAHLLMVDIVLFVIVFAAAVVIVSVLCCRFMVKRCCYCTRSKEKKA